MDAKPSLKPIGLLVIVVSAAALLSFILFPDPFFGWVELLFCPDHALSPDGQRMLSSTLYLGTSFMLVSGLGLVKAQQPEWRQKIGSVFFTEPLTGFKPAVPAPLAVLLLSTTIGLGLIAAMKLACRSPELFHFLYAKDKGLLDLFVPFTMLFSAALLFTAVWRLIKNPTLRKPFPAAPLVYLTIIAALVFYAGEEISWGQDFAHWETPALFAGNLEKQTNIHNYFNTVFDSIYISLSLILAVVILSTLLEYSGRWLLFKRLFLPHPSLIGLAFLIAVIAIGWYREQELLEEMLAAFFLFYSLRLFSCFRSAHFTLQP
ncbi:MAG: hypothetical protein GYA48_10005 [Chloroflexi bacterium]|nr:hypothetical protein [Chloroflexota bacterium]